MIDRRNRRSQEPTEALSMFLESSRAKLGLRALTISTPDGLLVAGAGTHLESVASMGAWVDRDPEVPPRIAARLATWRMRVNGMDLLLTSHGSRMTAELGEGVKRILAERRV